MKICIFSTTYFPKAGGAERFIHGLAENLTAKRHKVYVLVPYDKSLDLESSLSYKILKLRFLSPFRSNYILLEVMLFLNVLFYILRYRL